MADPMFTLQAYPPGSDLATGVKPNQVIWGRTGNDSLLGYQPLAPNREHTFIDLFLGDLAIEDPAFRTWNDTYILGDWTRPYYANRTPNNLGLNDLGFISDFNRQEDTIQLYGQAEDYQLIDVGVGSALVLQQENPDVVGFVLGNSGLDLESDYFDFAGNTPSSEPALDQARQLGSLGFDLSVNAATDPFGDVYIAGGTTGALQGTNEGLRDALVAKYDSQGNLLNTIQFGSSEFDTTTDIATDREGNVYLSGITEGDLAENKQAEVADAWVAKYDREGNLQWSDQFGEELIQQTYSIDVDDEGNAYLSGLKVESTVDVVTDNYWVAKYNTDGQRQWFTEDGTPNIIGSPNDFDESYGVAVANDGNVYATGWTSGDLGGENAGLYDGWLSQLGNDGEVNWTRQIGTDDYDWSWAVDTDSQGNVYATGWTLGDLGGSNAGSYDAWLTKYDKQGNQQWIEQFGTVGDDEAFNINIDPNDNIFLTGYTDNNLGGTNAGSFDAWVAQFDTDGNQLGIQQLGTSDFDQGYGITSDDAGNVYATGVTDGSLGATNAGSFDTWLAKLDMESGTLQNFGGASRDNFPQVPDWFAGNRGDEPSADFDMVDEIDSFFQDFLSSFKIEADGNGLGNLVRDPSQPTPIAQPTSVPEFSSPLSLLVFAAVLAVSKMTLMPSLIKNKTRKRSLKN